MLIPHRPSDTVVIEGDTFAEVKKREQARVDFGIILTGQEMPTADIALFTRLIFLAYDRDHHNQQERERFAELMQLRMYGATHITIQLVSLRDKFTERFELAWEKAKSDVALHASLVRY